MARNGTWGTEFKMMVLSHHLNTNIFSFDAGSNTRVVFCAANIDRQLNRDYTAMSLFKTCPLLCCVTCKENISKVC